jgi:hypothetical protein
MEMKRTLTMTLCRRLLEHKLVSHRDCNGDTTVCAFCETTAQQFMHSLRDNELARHRLPNLLQAEKRRLKA